MSDSDYKEEQRLANEAEILEKSVRQLLEANEMLIHLTAKLINKTKSTDDETRHTIQRAHALLTQGKKGLVMIKFLEAFQ